MDEAKYMRAYNRHFETGNLILQREGRKKLEWLHSQIVYQFHNYSAAANSSKQAGGFLSRLARGASASKVESLKPKIDAYADILKATAQPPSMFEEMKERVLSMWANCPHCGGQVLKESLEGHIKGCEQRRSDEEHEQELQSALEKQKETEASGASLSIDDLAQDTADAITEIINQNDITEGPHHILFGEEIALALLWQMRSDLWVRLSEFNADVYGAGFEEPVCKDEIDDYCYEANDEYSPEGQEALQRTVFDLRQVEFFKKASDIFSKNLRKMPDFESANKFGNFVIEQVFETCALIDAGPETYEEVFEGKSNERPASKPPIEIYENEPEPVSLEEFESQENLLNEFLERKGL